MDENTKLLATDITDLNVFSCTELRTDLDKLPASNCQLHFLIYYLNIKLFTLRKTSEFCDAQHFC